MVEQLQQRFRDVDPDVLARVVDASTGGWRPARPS
jgi:hypothetical protein